MQNIASPASFVAVTTTPCLIQFSTHCSTANAQTPAFSIKWAPGDKWEYHGTEPLFIRGHAVVQPLGAA